MCLRLLWCFLCGNGWWCVVVVDSAIFHCCIAINTVCVKMICPEACQHRNGVVPKSNHPVERRTSRELPSEGRRSPWMDMCRRFFSCCLQIYFFYPKHHSPSCTFQRTDGPQFRPPWQSTPRINYIVYTLNFLLSASHRDTTNILYSLHSYRYHTRGTTVLVPRLPVSRQLYTHATASCLLRVRLLYEADVQEEVTVPGSSLLFLL